MDSPAEVMDQDPLDLVIRGKGSPEEQLLEEIKELRSRQAEENRSLEDDYRHRHQRLQEVHEREIQDCIRRYFAKNECGGSSSRSTPQPTSHLAVVPGIMSGLAVSPSSSGCFGSPRHFSTISTTTTTTTTCTPMTSPSSGRGLFPYAGSSVSDEYSGCSVSVRHKLQEHLIQRRRRECLACSFSGQELRPGVGLPATEAQDCICDGATSPNGRSSGGKMRPVSRTYSAPLPLTNPTIFQPASLMAAASVDAPDAVEMLRLQPKTCGKKMVLGIRTSGGAVSSVGADIQGRGEPHLHLSVEVCVCECGREHADQQPGCSGDQHVTCSPMCSHADGCCPCSHVIFAMCSHCDPSSKESPRPKNEEVRQWAQSMEKLLSSPYGTALFRAFLQRDFAEENLDFILKVNEYREASPRKRPKLAWKLYRNYIAIGAPHELNLDILSRKVTDLAMITPHVSTFDSARKRIYNLLENDSYRRFLQWNVYLQLAYPDAAASGSAGHTDHDSETRC